MARARRRAYGIGLAGLALGGLCAAAVLPARSPRMAGEAAPQARVEVRTPVAAEAEAGPETGTRIVLGPGGADVRLFGELTEGAGERLERLLAADPRVRRIHLTSEGGLVDEGEALGAAIARYGLATYVPDYCVSACTLAFVRGRERFILPDSRVGFHAPYEAGPLGQSQPTDPAPERAAYVSAGVAPDFAQTALAVASSEMWFPDPGTLTAARVATRVVDAGHFPDSTLDDGDDAAHARATVLRNLGLLHGFEARAPHVVDAIAAWYLASYRGGVSEAEAFARLKRLAARLVARTLRRADDRATVALGRHLLEAMKRARPADCAAIGAEGDFVRAEHVLREHILRESGGEAPDPFARDLIARVLAGAPETVIPDAHALAEEAERPMPSTRPSTRPSDCARQRAAYARVLARPERRAAAELRALLAPHPAPRPGLEASAAP